MALSYSNFNKLRWYYYLNESSDKFSLFSKRSRSRITQERNIVIYRMIKPHGYSDYVRQYTYFDNHIDLSLYNISINDTKKLLHEVILGDAPHRCYFDIDIEKVNDDTYDLISFGNNVRDNIIMESEKLISELIGNNIDIIESGVGVYTSHGENKYSCHIILQRYGFGNHIEAKAFIKLLSERSSDIKMWCDNRIIDIGVYASLHSLRMLGSSKHDSDRIKVKDYEWYFTPKDRLIRSPLPSTRKDRMWEVTNSLVSYISGVNILPIDVPKFDHVNINIPFEYENIVMNSLSQMLNISILSPNFPFVISGFDSPFILLKRLHSSYCCLCGRTHDNIDSFILVRTDGTLMYNCRRNNSFTTIGHLNGIIIESANCNAESETENVSDKSVGYITTSKGIYEIHGDIAVRVDNENVSHDFPELHNCSFSMFSND